jgi:hypothetical protein
MSQKLGNHREVDAEIRRIGHQKLTLVLIVLAFVTEIRYISKNCGLREWSTQLICHIMPPALKTRVNAVVKYREMVSDR